MHDRYQRSDQMTTTVLDLRNDPEHGRAIRHYDRMRGHRFQPPKTDLAKVPALYETESVATSDKTVYVHYFTGSWDWYVTELDQESGDAFGLVKNSLGTEWGYFNLYELATTRVPVAMGSGGVRLHLPIERDLWFQPAAITEVLR